MSGVLQRLQLDAEARLLADAYFADIAIILQRTGVTEKEIQRRLSTVAGRGGKVGACVIVLLPSGGVPDADLPGPRLALTQSFIVLVHPSINEGSTGTGKEPEDIALRVLQLFHHAALGYGSVLVGGPGAIVPNDSFDGLTGFQINLDTFAGPVALTKVARPTISPSSGAAPQLVTLACATAGASIRYTTDGSYPSAQNANATVYAAPFNVAAATTVRAAAEKTGLQQSDVAQAIFT